ncbi:hypothetical protein [Nocardia farcinica]|nr:hypothetical protein [Nocardia farcinica]
MIRTPFGVGRAAEFTRGEVGAQPQQLAYMVNHSCDHYDGHSSVTLAVGW